MPCCRNIVRSASAIAYLALVMLSTVSHAELLVVGREKPAIQLDANEATRLGFVLVKEEPHKGQALVEFILESPGEIEGSAFLSAAAVAYTDDDPIAQLYPIASFSYRDPVPPSQGTGRKYRISHFFLNPSLVTTLRVTVDYEDLAEHVIEYDLSGI